MKVNLENKETEQEEIVQDENSAIEQEADLRDENIRRLELENARLEGEVRGRTASAVPAADSKQIKTQVWADVNTLDDDQFKQKWGSEKYKATAALLEQDFQASDTKNKQEIATLRAEQRLAAKYKDDFYDLKPEIDDVLSMASADVRQDPDKLAKLMETAYFAAKGKAPSAPKAKPKGENMNRSRITSGFEKPTNAPSHQEREDAPQDEVAAEYQQLARAFGIRSESERKELMSSNIVPMDLGNGKIYNGKEVVDKPGSKVAA